MMTREGAADRAAFDVLVDQTLVASLRSEQTVIWDKLSVHKSATAQQLIAAVSYRVVFLPSYSAHFAAIELVFSKLKTFLRPAQGRTCAALHAATTAAHARASPTVAPNHKPCTQRAEPAAVGIPVVVTQDALRSKDSPLWYGSAPEVADSVAPRGENKM